MTVYLLKMDCLFFPGDKSLQCGGLFFKGLIENTSSISQTTDGPVQSNSLGEIRQDFLLLPELPISIIENLRRSGLYGT